MSTPPLSGAQQTLDPEAGTEPPLPQEISVDPCPLEDGVCWGLVLLFQSFCSFKKTSLVCIYFVCFLIKVR